ncbi:unnamed protein product [Adineta ricciae]|uniref:Uncharacterized protein n=1 Tax=Adineta ricciae TaxID=249248 RepID=A0A816FA89_ADIRI|nr:unnamed protein product [Adineta ricciae]CAF1657350.1 unnamed protein product [Adineta ricciae]
MASIETDKDEKGNKSSTQVVIITSIDDHDNDKILSYLDPSNVETFIFDWNKKSSMNGCEDSVTNKKRSFSFSEQDTFSDATQNATIKKRKADLTCVVCSGHAIGYNFGQITCESCKGLNDLYYQEMLIIVSLAFFRRNALQSIEKTKCLRSKSLLTEIQCEIRHDMKHKCQRCRLLKCFEQGMRKDYILTPEQKMSKQKHLEENRRLRNDNPSVTTDSFKSLTPIVSPTSEKPTSVQTHHPSPSTQTLSESDWSCISQIQNAYFSASQSVPSASSVISFELAPDKMAAYMNTLDIHNHMAIRLINFVRAIPEFDELDERDRVILVKYNLSLAMFVRHSLNFDTARELCYDVDTHDGISPSDEAFAQHCKSLFILCYGYELNRMLISILHSLVDLVNKDPIVVQLLMVIAIFSKGLSADDDTEPNLIDEYCVYRAQSKYIDLLFRYLLQQSSFEAVAMKITHFIEQFLKIQRILRDFHQYIKSKVDSAYMNPLMKSLLHLT